MTIRTNAAILVTGCALLLGACGGDDETSSSSSTATTPPTTEPQATTPEETTPEETAPEDSAPEETTPEDTTEKVSANTASGDEIAAALEAAGVDNAERWAREVEEYRPYDDDPDLPKLRDELAKYNPGEGVVDKIVSALTP